MTIAMPPADQKEPLSELEHHGASLEAPDVVEQDNPGRIDDVVPTVGFETLPVVGLGGSAGSIPALQRFFEATPAESNLAYVVVLHLSSSHESVLAPLIQRWTKMRVKAASDGDTLQANCVYVIPPGKYLSAVGGRLTLTNAEPERGS